MQIEAETPLDADSAHCSDWYCTKKGGVLNVAAEFTALGIESLIKLDDIGMRIVGINIPDNKKIEYALPYIYGVGLPSAKKIVREAAVDPKKRAKDLTPPESGRIRELIEKRYKIEGDLHREITANIKRLRELNAYRGTRHSRGLPVRGQRTRTNSRTRRGNVRRTMGSGRKPSGSPT